MNKKRHTKQKDCVINYLMNNKDRHLTVGEIVANLKLDNEPVSQATVYRILGDLVLDGVVRKYIVSENKSCCYQYVENVDECREHYHLICDECGKAAHFESKELETLRNKIDKESSFEINMHKVILYGKCKNCRKGERDEKNI